MKDYEIHTFPNGIRLIHRQVLHTKIAHCGFILDIGSRDEAEDEVGIAHFIEHMAFKGTQKHKSIYILNRIDSVGGELNAYTTKEKICFHASLLNVHFERAVELLTDITFNSIFPEKEIAKERRVILEEMSMYADDPADALQDQFDELFFGNHPLGRNILGTTETVSRFTKEDFDKFISNNFSTERLVFSSVSALPFAKVVKIVEKYVSDFKHINPTRKRQLFENQITTQKQVNIKTTQAHCAIGSPAYSIYNDKRIALFILVDLLGGPSMNSRLNLAIREKYGFVYSIDANYNSFIDTGIMTISFATEPKTLNRCIELVNKELRKLRETPLSTAQLSRVKQQLMGQLAMSEESNNSFMLMMGKSILDLGKVESLAHLFEQINSVSAQELREIANEVFDDKKLSMLTFVPEPIN